MAESLEFQLITLIRKIYGTYYQDWSALFTFSNILDKYSKQFLTRANNLYLEEEGDEGKFIDK